MGQVDHDALPSGTSEEIKKSREIMKDHIKSFYLPAHNHGFVLDNSELGVLPVFVDSIASLSIFEDKLARLCHLSVNVKRHHNCVGIQRPGRHDHNMSIIDEDFVRDAFDSFLDSINESGLIFDIPNADGTGFALAPGIK